jgi:hypothetical protein
MISKIIAGLLVVILSVAVLWQTLHIIDWCWMLYTSYGDGTLSGYLRMHAYTYVSHIFGDSHGWILGGS